MANIIQKNAIERFHVGVLKQLLGVHKKTSNIAMLLETGRHPMIVSAQVQAIKYFFIFSYIKQGKLLNRYYEVEKRCSENNDRFTAYIIDTLNKIGLGNIWRDQLIHKKDLSKNTIVLTTIKKRLTDISSQSIVTSLKENTGKLTFLKQIKDSHNCEPYLKIENFEHRRAITKIRTSSHKLEIETGRWRNIHRTDRICICICISRSGTM